MNNICKGCGGSSAPPSRPSIPLKKGKKKMEVGNMHGWAAS